MRDHRLGVRRPILSPPGIRYMKIVYVIVGGGVAVLLSSDGFGVWWSHSSCDTKHAPPDVTARHLLPGQMVRIVR